MAVKTPIRTVFDGSNNATGLAEFQSGEFIALTHGGTGASLSIGSAGQVLKVNSGASALEFGNVEAVFNIDGMTDGSGITIADGDDFAISDAGTEKKINASQIATYVQSGISGDITISSGTAAIGSGVIVNADINASAAIAVSKTALTAGTGISLSTNTLNVDAAQTGITSLLATDIKIGEDNQTKIDFETADEIHFYAANAEQVFVSDGVFGPQTDSDVDLGTTSARFKDAFVDSLTVTDNLTIGGNFTVNGTTTTVNSTTVTIDDPIFTLGGDGTPSSDDNKDRGIEFKYHTGSAAKVGFFGFDDSTGKFTFIPDATNSSEVFSGTAGTVVATTFEGALTGNVTGNVSGTAATVTGAAQSNITSLGTLTTLTVDNVIVNGTTIGHTDDTDLITLADGVATVAGELSVTTLDIGGTNVTSTATELNIVDGDTSAGTTAVAGSDGIVTNDAGTMRQTTVDTFDTYLSATTKTLTNKTLTTPVIAEIDSGSTITLDATTDIVLDADGGDIFLKDDGTTFGEFTNSSTDFVIKSTTSNKDILFKGNDGGSEITALTLDMSDAGTATFNHDIKVPDDGKIGSATTPGAITIESNGQVTLSGNAQIPSSLFRGTDGNITFFGANSDVRLTHVHDTGLLLTETTNSTPTLQFTDANESIGSDGSKLIIKSGGTTFNIPTADGSDGQVIKTDGSGTLSFGDAASSGFVESTITTAPGASGNFDLTKANNSGDSETPFTKNTNGFDVTVTHLYDLMEPKGADTSNNTDFGSGESHLGA